ncbi:hypothetical protein [Anaeromyxobacter oryzae]|uniref:hypothetical protein n=1 Tax=Anaeromyxobacter oryzae TaxID=2918170 RepID=UPI0020BD8B49|nr:hypothetical protein [Anaeromyxobacter oryzae]
MPKHVAAKPPQAQVRVPYASQVRRNGERQQSPLSLHGLPRSLQPPARHWPAAQYVPEQHWASLVQASPAARQIGWQVLPDVPAVQASPEQQSEVAAHAPP